MHLAFTTSAPSSVFFNTYKNFGYSLRSDNKAGGFVKTHFAVEAKRLNSTLFYSVFPITLSGFTALPSRRVSKCRWLSVSLSKGTVPSVPIC